jgi:hypothetical protein
MNFKPQKFDFWLRHQEFALPSLTRLFDSTTSPVMILGASVLALYADQEWIPPLRRRTGDLDLSVSIPHGENDYLALKDILIHGGYTVDDVFSYRYRPPHPIQGTLAYIDLLAQPPSAEPAEIRRAIAVMGAGEEFRFEGFDFALHTGIPVRGSVVLPNPIGFLSLKKTSYRDDPIRRIKDLGDIIELCVGMVSRGSHYELERIRETLRSNPETIDVLAMVKALASLESTTWDIEDARQELLKRGFSSSEIDEEFGILLNEWATVVEDGLT